MLRQRDKSLSAANKAKLEGYQDQVNGAGGYPDQVKEAKTQWDSKKRNAPFKEIKEALFEIGPPGKRCAYCEDSIADEIEHIVPKDWVPALTFVFTNYVYSCGPCNGPKNNRYGVVLADDTVEEQTRERSDTPAPAPDRPSALIDIRSEDPLDFFELDLDGTFWFVAPEEPGEARSRAQFTLDVLHLNDRESLVTARRNYFGHYRAHLRDARYRRSQDEHADLSDIAEVVGEMYHRTVWEEMKRQRPYFPELTELFDAVPEALDW